MMGKHFWSLAVVIIFVMDICCAIVDYNMANYAKYGVDMVGVGAMGMLILLDIYELIDKLLHKKDEDD